MKNRKNSCKFTSLKTNISWIDYRALAKIGLPVNIDRLCSITLVNISDILFAIFCSLFDSKTISLVVHKFVDANLADSVAWQAGRFRFQGSLM